MASDVSDAGRGEGRRAARTSTGPCALRLAFAMVAGLTVANCSSPMASRSGPHPSELKYGVRSSPRVIPEGQPIPKGGGRDMVGQPYQVAGRTYVPHEGRGYDREGSASWYGSAFHGRLTANGEVFDREAVAAAHPTLPLPSYVRVTNVGNGRSMIVRVNDRGPYERDRLIDLSERAADALGFHRRGTTRVRVQYVGRAGLSGSDDETLLASLRTDGLPAKLEGASKPTLVAEVKTLRQAVDDYDDVLPPPRPSARTADPPLPPKRLASIGEPLDILPPAQRRTARAE